MNETALRLEQAFSRFAWLDPHTHIDAAHLSARGLDDILLYHMGVSDLYAAGCPSGARVDDDRSEDDAVRRLQEAVPYLPRAKNTFISWGARIILRDLYDWDEPVTESNWRKLHTAIAERAADPAWPREILRRANIVRSGTELWRGRDGSADDILCYSLEWAFFSRAQWGQPDISLYELERTWNQDAPDKPIAFSFDRKTAAPLRKICKTVDDVDDAVAHYCALIPYDRLAMVAAHLSTDIDYGYPDAAAMADALSRRDRAGDRERDIYASYITHRFLAELEKHGDKVVFEFSLAAEPLPHESAARVNQRTIAQVAEIVARYPGLRFTCFNASRHANQALCTLVRELPNLSLSGYWWHSFFPGAIRQVMEERLDMLPLNKQVGFFSDAYCADWAYGKAMLVRKFLADVLADKIRIGQYTFDDAVAIAKSILYETPRDLFRMSV